VNVSENPMVSVCMITYNHEPYIRQAIEGVLMQQCNFTFELVIGEDFSSDATRLICEEYSKKHPGIIKLLPSVTNHGMIRNFLRTLNSCTGKYIALCEGDDYWTDQLKMQKQVNLLEADPKVIFTFHDNIILHNESGKEVLRVGRRKIDNIVDVESLILEKNFATASVIFRNILNFNLLPYWFDQILQPDYALFLLLAEKGTGVFIPDVMSVYRVHEKGIWSGTNTDILVREQGAFFSFAKEYFSSNKIRRAIRMRKKLLYYNYGIHKIRRGHIITGFLQSVTNLVLFGDKRVNTSIRKLISAIKTGLYISKQKVNRKT